MEPRRTWSGMVCLLGVVVILGGWCQAAEYGGGSGTSEAPYQIWTPEQMNTIGINPADWGKSFILMADVDMSAYTGTQYNIIGRTSPYFTGIFDGGGYAIRNLTYTTTEEVSNVGLFGVISDAMIKNLGMENVNIVSGGKFIGGLAGGVLIGSTIAGCYTTGHISGTGTGDYLKNYIGGLAGINIGNIFNSYSTCQVGSKGNGVGGFVGGNSGSIWDCYSTGLVSGISVVGGLAGISGYDSYINASKGIITNCYSTGSVNGTGDYIGGLVGMNGADISFSGSITKCHSTGTVSATGRYIGGLVGCNGPSSLTSTIPNATITNCYSTGNITSGNVSCTYIGGLVGYNSGGTVKYCLSTGNINAPQSQYVGGLAGYNVRGGIGDCYSTGSVIGLQNIGGLAGGAFGYRCSIINCYSVGTVGGSSNLGGLLGVCLSTDVVVTDCFWDTETSGLATSSRGTGKTTMEMKTLLTFTSAGWDFVNGSTDGLEHTWAICEGSNYPRLTWQISAGDWVCPEGVAIEDMEYFVGQWLKDTCSVENDYCNGVDMNASGAVDLADFALFASIWLKGI